MSLESSTTVATCRVAVAVPMGRAEAAVAAVTVSELEAARVPERATWFVVAKLGTAAAASAAAMAMDLKIDAVFI